MYKVKVKDFPVRYKDKRYLVGEEFEMDKEHVNESLVEVIEEIQSKEIEDLTVAELKKYASDNDIDLSNVTKRDDILAVILGTLQEPEGGEGDG